MPTFQKYWSSIVLVILEIPLTEEAVFCLLWVSISTSLVSLAALISKGIFLRGRCCQAARKCVSLQTSPCYLCHTNSACGRRWFPSRQHSQLWVVAAINKWLRQTCLALHIAGLGHRVCFIIAVLISVAGPKLSGRGLEESERVKRENATCLP